MGRDREASGCGAGIEPSESGPCVGTNAVGGNTPDRGAAGTMGGYQLGRRGHSVACEAQQDGRGEVHNIATCTGTVVGEGVRRQGTSGRYLSGELESQMAEAEAGCRDV